MLPDTALPDIGSRWYISGHHWEVYGHTTRDGEPAVRVRLVGKRKPTFTWIWRLATRGPGAAVPSSL